MSTRNNSNRNASDPMDPSTWTLGQTIRTGLVFGLAGLATFASYRYRISKPNQYLVMTGLGIRDIKIMKKGFQWPFQKMSVISLTPANYNFRLQAMSSEKMEFVLPMSLTIAPKDNPIYLANYGRFLSGADEKERENIIMGVIEGETRAASAARTVEEIFRDRAEFRQITMKNVDEELSKFGLHVFNANIKELEDAEGSEYFRYIRQRTREGAANQAKVEVADAKFKGDTGSKEKEKQTRIITAGYESEAVAQENHRKAEIAESAKDLAVKKAEFFKQSEIARIEAEKAAAIRDAELQKSLEEVNQTQMTAALRATLVSDATAKAEAKIKEAEGVAQSIRLKAEADLYAQQKTAEGIQAVYEAQAQGVREVIGSFNGNVNGFINYEMIQKDLFPKIAEINSRAIQGLNPNVNYWYTGPTDGNKKDFPEHIQNLAKCVFPLFSTIGDQTGMKLPDWFYKKPVVTSTEQKKNDVGSDYDENSNLDTTYDEIDPADLFQSKDKK